MFFLIRRLQFGRNWFREVSSACKGSRVNLNRNIICNSRDCSTRGSLSLPEKDVMKYLKSITDAYKSKYQQNHEFTSLIQIREIVDLLEERLHIEENIKTLEELGREDEEIKKSCQDEYSLYASNLKESDEKLLNIIVEKLGREQCTDIVFEITAGVGGQEAMLFTSDLFNMYQSYFQHMGFTHETTEIDAETGIGGIRHASILVSGLRCYEMLRHEGGVHRVQRVPSTEKSGRMHTSTATIVVMPQPSEIEVKLLDKDLKIETKRSSGPGGQSVNKTDSAVRIIHLPTGLSVETQSDRSQIKNKQIAFLKLRTKIFNMQLDDRKAATGTMRKQQRGMSQRNEKIRTYNYNQDRVTDHRLPNGTMHNLKGFMEGGENLENLQELLQRHLQLKILQESIEKLK